jgi:hypothetical protein
LSAGPNFYGNWQMYLPVGIGSSWEAGKRASQSISFSPSVSMALSSQLRANLQMSLQHYDDLRTRSEANGC